MRDSVCVWCVLRHFSPVCLFAVPWTIALQAPLSMGFSRREHWSGLPCLPPRDLLTQGSGSSASPALQAASLPLNHWGAPGRTDLSPLRGKVVPSLGILTLKDGEGDGTHSSTLAWKIPWAEEPGGLQSMGSLKVGHD